ncbi:MAG TPA: SDR family oxidoreductase [Dehalococcoidia bacterium]|jgi:NAD(P)-dependent dehydrogenase (short-subunit alcohol dehydrogenase family)|nr:SDR family oxidoreductase [Dehalococcoidia bacterium]
MAEDRFTDRVAIVTGGGRGIGRAIAQGVAREGARVVVTARTADEIADVAHEIVLAGGEAIGVVCDVSDEGNVQQMVDEAISQWGRIDILVNNAATNLPNIDVVDMEPDAWRRVVDVNLTGPFLCARAVLPKMIEQGSGAIVNISSIGGRHGGKGRGPYRAAKAGLINLTETLAAENFPHGVRVNCVCPGGVETEMLRVIGASLDRQLMTPDEMANVVLYLASDESSAVTGTSIDAFGPTHPLFSGQMMR